MLESILPGQVMPSSVLSARLALAPAAPVVPTSQWRPVSPTSSPNPRDIGTTVQRAVTANMFAQVYKPSTPTNSWYATPGQPGSADNAGNIAGAGANTPTGQGVSSIALPFFGNVNPLWVVLVGAAVAFIILKD